MALNRWQNFMIGEEGELNLGEKILRAEQKSSNSDTKTAQTLAEAGFGKGEQSSPEDNSDTLPKHRLNTFLHKKCALCVHKKFLQLAPELELIIHVWADLDDEVKQTILNMIWKEVIK